MTQYIHTGRGYRRLSDVKSVRIDNEGEHTLWDGEGEKISDYGEELIGRIVSIIPIAGDWEQIYTCEDEKGETKVFCEPVIAWGLTTLGAVIPVTPTARQGLPNGPALRKVGRPEIYVGDSTYDDEESWLRPKVG